MATTPEAGPEQKIEYSILTYGFTGAADSPPPPETVLTTENMEEALKKAENLSEGKGFLKVEVKKKFFDEKNKRNIEMVLRSFEGKDKKPMSIYVILAIAVACGVVTFGAAFLVGQMMRLHA